MKNHRKSERRQSERRGLIHPRRFPERRNHMDRRARMFDRRCYQTFKIERG